MKNRSNFDRVNSETDGNPSASVMRETMLPLRSLLRRDVLVLTAIFVVLYFYKLANFSLSIDDEFAAVRTSADVWVLQGRWVNYLIERFLVPQSVLPVFPMLAFGVMLSVSYRVLLTAFGVRQLRYVHYLTFPLFVAFPTWYFLEAFASNIVAAGIGQLLIACAVSTYVRAVDESNARRTLKLSFFSALLIAAALGTYQAFVFSFVALVIAIAMIDLIRNDVAIRVIFKRLALACVIAIVGVLFYEIIDSGFRHLLRLNDSEYLSVFLNWRSFLAQPLFVIKTFVGSIGDVYGGRSTIYGAQLIAVPMIFAIGIVSIACIPLTMSKRMLLIALGLAVAIAPFMLGLTAGGMLPTRALIAVPCVIWFFALVSLTTGSRWRAYTAFGIVAFATVQIVYCLNLMQASNQFARVHDEMLAASVYLKIAQVNVKSDSAQPLTVDFYGAKSFDSVLPRPFSSSSGSSFFEWDGGNLGRIINYMRLIGYGNLVAANDSRRKDDLAAFASMPAWPAEGSVKLVDGVTLVKLGNTPGWPFNVPK